MNIINSIKGRIPAGCILLVLFFGCATGNGADYYEAIEGRATITAIKTSEYNPDPQGTVYVDIFFDFVPAEPGRADRYRFKKTSDKNQRLFVNSWGNHQKKWVARKRITVGKSYPAARFEKKGGFGSLPPVYFRIPQLEPEKK